MQFKVPQNVQREDTIVGPLTFKQLIICGIGGGIAYGFYTVLSKEYTWPVWFPPVLFFGGFTIAFAFVKVHDLTFLQYLSSLFAYHYLPKKRIWIKGSADVITPLEEPKTSAIESAEQTKKEKQENTMKKLDSLVQILDSKGMTRDPNKQ